MIHHGSIEVIKESGENFGFPITPLHPLEEGGKMAAGVKARTGVQVGARIEVDGDDLDRLGPTHVGSWSGNTAGGDAVTVRIYRTSEGG